jgi:hypothetical protein
MIKRAWELKVGVHPIGNVVDTVKHGNVVSAPKALRAASKALAAL